MYGCEQDSPLLNFYVESDAVASSMDLHNVTYLRHKLQGIGIGIICMFIILNFF